MPYTALYRVLVSVCSSVVTKKTLQIWTLETKWLLSSKVAGQKQALLEAQTACDPYANRFRTSFHHPANWLPDHLSHSEGDQGGRSSAVSSLLFEEHRDIKGVIQVDLLQLVQVGRERWMLCIPRIPQLWIWPVNWYQIRNNLGYWT